MDKKIVIMLLNTDPDRPANLGTPFFQASAAAAMDLEVEIYFSAKNIALLRPGVAEQLFPGKEKIGSKDAEEDQEVPVLERLQGIDEGPDDGLVDDLPLLLRLPVEQVEIGVDLARCYYPGRMQTNLRVVIASIVCPVS